MIISRWNELYENAQSRKVNHAAWLALPNCHDGERYAEIFEQENGIIIFGCWILMLQVASKCKPRGNLLRDDGSPHTSLSLFRKTRCPKSHFDLSIPFLLRIGWIEEMNLNQKKTLTGSVLGARWEGAGSALVDQSTEAGQNRTEVPNDYTIKPQKRVKGSLNDF